MRHLIHHALLDVGDLLVDREGSHPIVGNEGHVEADGGGGAWQQAAATSLDRWRPQTAGLGSLTFGGVVALEARQTESVTTWQLTGVT